MTEPCIRIDSAGAFINGVLVNGAQSVDFFHQYLGQPSRIFPAGSPAPAGHRNNQIHFYDDVGITLNEHHYTNQIHAISVVLDPENAIHPTTHPFSGELVIGGLSLNAGDVESTLAESQVPFISPLAGTWFGTTGPGADNGPPVSLSVRTICQKQNSGGRCKTRNIVSLSIGLEHDPWDTTHRPDDAA